MPVAKFVLATMLSFLALPALALNTSITLVADSTVTATANEVVTFGLPLAVGDVTATTAINVSIGGVEQRIHVSAGLRWHWLDNSLRSVTIQLQGVNMSAGSVVLVITDNGRNNNNDLTAVAASTGWATATADKSNLPFPRVFAMHEPAYLVSSGLLPPSTSGSVASGVGKLQYDQFNNGFGKFNYATGETSGWLFDRATAMLKAYITTGELRFLKEGFLAKQYYYTHVRNDGSKPAAGGGSGCWSKVSCSDGKYIYTEPAKLAWGLFGDNSQWTPALINNMALQADLGNSQPGTRDLFSSEQESFTERAAGIAGLAEVNAYEITGDATVLAHLKERIAALRDMQQTPKSWDTANNWLPMSGAFTHSWAVHEGETLPPLGTANDRRFSPWMSENIADFLWHSYYVISDKTLQGQIAEMLRQLGNAIDKFGFASSYVTGEGVNATYERKPGITATEISCSTSNNLPIELMYSGSAYASAAALLATNLDLGPAVDQHNVEVILPLALAYYFETNAAARTRLQARIAHMQRQWTANPNKSCATTTSPPRLFNWQHRSNSIRTWEWVNAQSSGGFAALDLPAFEAGIKKLPAEVNTSNNGNKVVKLGPSYFSVAFAGEGVLQKALIQPEASFGIRGAIVDPASYEIYTIYPTGRTQRLSPTLLEVGVFNLLLQSLNYSYQLNVLNGQLAVKDTQGTVIWRGIPAYDVRPLTSNQASITLGTDYNGDRLADVLFNSGQWSQVLYSLGF